MSRPRFQLAVFWLRRSFQVAGPVPEVALLNIHKAKYGTQVWLNILSPAQEEAVLKGAEEETREDGEEGTP